MALTQINGEQRVALRCQRGKEKIRFLKLDMPEADTFFQLADPRASAYALVTWMMLLNASRILGDHQFRFTPRFRCVTIKWAAVSRSLDRLAEAGLIEVHRSQGKSPRITIL